MTIETTPFKDLLVIHNPVFSDHRGVFQESFNEARFRIETGLNVTFVQDNESVSALHVLRGLHFQIPPASQAKLVRVSRGRVRDVVVDLRRSQPTYGQHFSIELSADNHTQMYVPEGMAHGFYVLEPDTIFSYKCTRYYHAEYDRVLKYNDPALGIDWGPGPFVLSEKDLAAPLLNQLDHVFI
ncbi:MAG: dTDP-4-dehydrorhamnose 3,5-epimerase [Flavobacteriales bacterium]|nr:dTDP-4-dehydrorhamnose 3,5-epimerase [Flavobacteriales bacterium]